MLNQNVQPEIHKFTDLIDYVDGVELVSEQFDHGMMKSGFNYELYYEDEELFNKSIEYLNELKNNIFSILNEGENQLKKLSKEIGDLKKTNKKITAFQNEIKKLKIKLKE